jgi:hypothetical protein
MSKNDQMGRAVEAIEMGDVVDGVLAAIPDVPFDLQIMRANCQVGKYHPVAYGIALSVMCL